MSHQTDRHMIPGPAGTLEVVVEIPDAASRGIAIVCHPHPLHGGTLTNKVVHTLANTLREMSFIAVRFNFRGVGKSEGGYAEGIGEQDDLRAVVAWVKRQYGELPLWLGGFSFGAYVALAVGIEDIRQLITVAPPVNIFSLENMQQPDCPWLLIQGEADELVPADQVREWLQANQLSATAQFVPDAEHFFHGKLNLLKQIVQDNLA